VLTCNGHGVATGTTSTDCTCTCKYSYIGLNCETAVLESSRHLLLATVVRTGSSIIQSDAFGAALVLAPPRVRRMLTLLGASSSVTCSSTTWRYPSDTVNAYVLECDSGSVLAAGKHVFPSSRGLGSSLGSPRPLLVA
jgi:hypothetical protein